MEERARFTVSVLFVSSRLLSYLILSLSHTHKHRFGLASNCLS
jgi:hypothetical protein